MAITSFVRADEINHGNTGASDDGNVEWICRGTDMTVTEVLNRAETTTDLIHDGLERKNHRYRQVTPEYYRVIAEYAIEDQKNQREQSPGEVQFAFDDTVFQDNLKFAISTRLTFASDTIPDAKVPKLNEGIKVQPDGIVEGTGVFEPESGFSYTLTNDEQFFTDAQRRLISTYRAHVNDVPWKGYERGEVLFMGTSGQIADTGKSTIQMRFAVRENIHVNADGSHTSGGVTVPGPFIVAGLDLTPDNQVPPQEPFVIEGWELADTFGKFGWDDVDVKQSMKIDVVRILQLYRYAKFVDLGLGT